MKKDIEENESLDKKKVLWMSDKLHDDFKEVSEHETGKKNKFNQHLRHIMKREVRRFRSKRKKT